MVMGPLESDRSAAELIRPAPAPFMAQICAREGENGLAGRREHRPIPAQDRQQIVRTDHAMNRGGDGELPPAMVLVCDLYERPRVNDRNGLLHQWDRMQQNAHP